MKIFVWIQYSHHKQVDRIIQKDPMYQDASNKWVLENHYELSICHIYLRLIPTFILPLVEAIFKIIFFSDYFSNFLPNCFIFLQFDQQPFFHQKFFDCLKSLFYFVLLHFSCQDYPFLLALLIKELTALKLNLFFIYQKKFDFVKH